jgi:hypothetical protein
MEGAKAMNKDERKGLNHRLEQRILDGERKADIYAEYPEGPDAILVAKVLAQIPTFERREQFKALNWVLIFGLGVLTTIKVLAVSLFVMTEMPKAVWLILLAPAINLFLIWMVARFQGAGYLLVIGFGAMGISKAAEGLSKASGPIEFILGAFNIACVIACIILAAYLRKKLLPQTGFTGPHKDAAGRPVFEA